MQAIKSPEFLPDLLYDMDRSRVSEIYLWLLSRNFIVDQHFSGSG